MKRLQQKLAGFDADKVLAIHMFHWSDRGTARFSRQELLDSPEELIALWRCKLTGLFSGWHRKWKNHPGAEDSLIRDAAAEAGVPLG